MINPQQNRPYLIRPFIFIVVFLTSFVSFSTSSCRLEKQADIAISELYHRLNRMPNLSMAERIDWISARFKGNDYILGSLGEGPDARYDQFPRYRLDAFDCDTYVNTVIALAQGDSLKSFQRFINLARYQQGKVDYLARNHFTSIDWNRNNQNRGLLQDITLLIQNPNQQPVAKWAIAVIDKSGWYAHKTIGIIRLQKKDPVEEKKRLHELKAKGHSFKPVISKIPYLPLTALFDKNNKPNLYLFDQIPNGSVVEIIRPNWDLKKQIGTSLNVSHLGFAIRSKGRLIFRQASSSLNKVVDVSLIDYLKDAKNSPTIKGINIQIIHIRGH